MCKKYACLACFLLVIIFIEPQNLNKQRKGSQQLVRKKWHVLLRTPTRLKEACSQGRHLCIQGSLKSVCDAFSTSSIYSSLSTFPQSHLPDKRREFYHESICLSRVMPFALMFENPPTRIGSNFLLIVFSRSVFDLSLKFFLNI